MSFFDEMLNLINIFYFKNNEIKCGVYVYIEGNMLVVEIQIFKIDFRDLVYFVLGRLILDNLRNVILVQNDVSKKIWLLK